MWWPSRGPCILGLEGALVGSHFPDLSLFQDSWCDSYLVIVLVLQVSDLLLQGCLAGPGMLGLLPKILLVCLAVLVDSPEAILVCLQLHHARRGLCLFVLRNLKCCLQGCNCTANRR